MACSRLDDGLVFWGNASGVTSGWDIHLTHDMQVLLAGSCSGYFRTGRFIDYRNRELRRGYNGGAQIGIAYNRLLIELMYAMGLAPADFEPVDGQGFGDYSGVSGTTYNSTSGSYVDNATRYDVTDRRAGLPFVKAA